MGLAAGSLFLAACGGGGGDGGTTPPPANNTPVVPTSLEQVQGFWSGPLDTGTVIQAVILRNGEMWATVQGGGTIQSAGKAQGVVVATGVRATGVLTNLQPATSQALTVEATSVAPKATLTGTVTAPAPAKPANWTYNARYDTPLPVADFAGRWTGTAGGQTVSATWNITAAGALTGTSSTGCTYTGTLAPQSPAVAVVSVSVAENCAGTSQTYTGIATMNEPRTQTSFILAFASGAQVTFLAMQK